MPRQTVTIQDVSRRANVSATTVSHALSGRGRVGAETRERVKRAAQELGYVANPLARGLKSGRTMTLVVELPATTEAVGLDSAFLRDVLVGAAEAAIKAGYLLAITSRTSSSGLELPPHDGAIVVDPEGTDQSSEQARRGAVPLVTVARLAEDGDTVPAVDSDYAGGVRLILDHLKRAGYESPALLTTRHPFSYATLCLQSYQAWTSARKVREVVRFAPGYPSAAGGKQAVKKLLRLTRVPDAIVAVTEPLAVGAVRALGEANLAIPEDVGVACLTDSERLRSADVPVTALEVYPKEIGRHAVEVLVRLVESDGEMTVPRLTELPTKLNVRLSTSKKGL